MRVGTIIKAVEFKKAISSSYLIHVDFGKIGIKKLLLKSLKITN